MLLLCPWALNQSLFSLGLGVITCKTKGWRGSGLEESVESISLQELPWSQASNFTLD